jgi:nitroreductase
MCTLNRLSLPPLSAQELKRTVDWAIASRRSVRAFLPTAVPHEEIEAILDIARFSASGVNMQPWRVHVVTGDAKDRLSMAIAAIDNDPQLSSDLQDPYEYYPREWVTPYVDRRRKVGWDLYGLLGIAKGEKQRMHQQHGRNYRFFDAPVGLLFTLDKVLEQGSLLDYGMFLQSVMLAARGRGLHTCPQAAFLKYHNVISDVLNIPAEQMLVCGMSLGYADPVAIENTLVTAREPVSAFAVFHHNNKETCP